MHTYGLRYDPKARHAGEEEVSVCFELCGAVSLSSVCNPNPRSIALSISSTFLIPRRPCMATYNLYIIPPYICHVSPSYGRVFGTYSRGMVELCRSGRTPTQGPGMAFPRPRTSAGHCYNPPLYNYHATPCLLTIGTTPPLPLVIVASRLHGPLSPVGSVELRCRIEEHVRSK